MELAYFSPLPDDRSGISAYSVELLRYLELFYNITLIYDNLDKVNESIKNRYKIISLDEFSPKNFDRLLYNMGNNIEFHANIYKTAIKNPGIVILHDFFLSGFMSNYHKIDPNFNIQDEIFYSHSYKGLTEFFLNSYDEFAKHYPINRRIIENSYGIITHTEKSLELAELYYQNRDFLTHIPHLRASIIPDKQTAKKILSLQDKTIFCVFGLIGPNKMHKEILYAWNESLKNDQNAVLIYASGTTNNEYFLNLKDFVKTNSIENIIFTNWLDNNEYHIYQSACDVSIQLRASDNGEASGALLDCFNYESLVISNYSNFKDYTLYIDNICELKLALKTCLNNNQNIVKNAKNLIITKHNPLSCASRIRDLIEKSYKNSNKLNVHKSRVLLDISAIAREDLKTGIARVVLQELNAILKISHMLVEPIYFDQRDGKKGYFYAGDFITSRHGIPFKNDTSTEVDIRDGDIFYGIDFPIFYKFPLFESAIYEAYKIGFFNKLKSKKTKTYFKIHDILPITSPQFFPYHACELHLQWIETIRKIDPVLIATSQKTKNDLEKYGFNKIKIIPLGSNFTELKVRHIKFKNRTFLAVGTIEERKAQKAIVNTFLRLQNEGIEADLIIVGKLGRVDEDFKEFLCKKHKNIKYLKFVSDRFLCSLYSSTEAIIAASYDEGYGLPMVEASYYGACIIARDIPVFRDILGENATYFKDDISLYETIKNYKSKKTNRQIGITWEYTAREILKLIKEDL